MGLGLGFGLPIPRFTGEDFSILFDGSNDEIDFTTSAFQAALADANFKSSGSASIWVRLNTTNTNCQLWDFCIDTNNRINIQYKHNVTHKYVFMFKGGGSQKTAETGTLTHENDGNFHHIVCTWDKGDANEQKLYLDGSLIATTGLASIALSGDFDDAASASGVEVITGTSFNGNADLNGYLDDFAVYSDVLSASDVTTLYNSGKAGPVVKTNLLALWRFNEGSGTTVTSEVGGYTGTFGSGSNAPTFSKINASQ